MTGSAGGSIEHTLCESVHEIEFLNGNFNGNVDDPDWKTIKAVSYTHLTLPTKA